MLAVSLGWQHYRLQEERALRLADERLSFAQLHGLEPESRQAAQACRIAIAEKHERRYARVDPLWWRDIRQQIGGGSGELPPDLRGPAVTCADLAVADALRDIRNGSRP